MSIAKKVGKGDGDSPLFPMFRVWIFVTHHRLAGYKYSKFICLQCSWFKKSMFKFYFHCLERNV